MKNESVIYTVCKIIRHIFKFNSYFEAILDFDFFQKLYSFGYSQKFIVASEMFKTIFSIIEKPKIDSNIFHNFLLKYKENLCSLFYKIFVNTKKDEQNYLVKRETLILINKILGNSSFDGFKEYFTNNTSNLKMIMLQLNDDSLKIKFQSTKTLYHFFYDLENKNEKNKENFNLK